MEAYLRTTGIISFCLLLQPVHAKESVSIDAEQHQTVEKGCKAKSKAEIKITGSSNCCKAKGPIGKRGAEGAEGLPGEGLIHAYAAAYQGESQNLGQPSAGESITVPFTTLDHAVEITLDSDTDTFTLPKGIYTVRFQFLIKTDKDYSFNRIYLDIGGSELNMTWNSTQYDPPDSKALSSFKGSTIFQVLADDTAVRLRGELKLVDTDDLIFKDQEAPLNYPARIVFEKIADLV